MIKISFGISNKEFVKALKRKEFILNFIQLLQDIPFATYQLQSPSIHKPIKNFYMNVYESPGLQKMKLDTKTYKEYFKKNQDIAVFCNLTNDTLLIVPKILPKTDKNIYKNISIYSRNAPLKQQVKLWKTVGKELDKCKGGCYLNTHGYGIGWLHIRIDQTPKYYSIYSRTWNRLMT